MLTTVASGNFLRAIKIAIKEIKPAKHLKKCKFFEKHFDSEFNFLYSYYDKNTKTMAISKKQIGIAPER